MQPPGRHWLRAAALAALAYPIIGVVFGALAGLATSPSSLTAWRLAAWALSAMTFAVHLGYEHTRLSSTPAREAGHVSAAVALGGFLLAVWINLYHGLSATPQSRFAPLALVAFPLITGVPAFLVGFFLLALLTRRAR